MATIRDVARAAGVSIATVSAVINNSVPVSAPVRQRVLDAIGALQYEPHRGARSLKMGVAQTIGLVISDVTNPFFSAVARTVERELNERGHALFLCNSDEDPAKEETYLRVLQSHRVAGIIIALAGTGDTYADRVCNLLKAPTVLIDRYHPKLPFDSVRVDNVAGARAATARLCELGHKRIGIILGVEHVSTSDERLAGYRQALAEHGIAFDPALVRYGSFRVEKGFDAASELIRDVRPSALFAANNLMAIGTMQAIAAAGLVCPADVAVASFDDFVWATAFQPRMTGIQQPTEELARSAVELLFERIRGTAPSGPPRRVVLPVRLAVRNSCGAPLPAAPLAPLHSAG
jgi:LacI family transcriptional regulator